jgi:ATP-dependent exoDNAse (exonuclease V) beta subunit
MTSNDAQGVVHTVLASAGTGKTHTLVDRIATAVLGGLDSGHLLAATFTKTAASELGGRIRERLIDAGRTDAAATLLSARIGTVNSVCGGLVGEFALELGRSPVAEVIADERQAAVFSEAAADAIAACAATQSALAERLGLGDTDYRPSFGKVRPGWRDDLWRLAGAARINGLAPSDLDACAARSVETLLALMPTEHAGETAQSLDQALDDALRACAAELSPSRLTGLKKGTLDKDVPKVRDAVGRLDRGDRLPWLVWASLSKLGATKADEHFFANVVAAAGAHSRHPGLRADLDAFIRGQFSCVTQALEAYAAFKAARGLLDFIDQETLALAILRDPAHQPLLRERIRAVFIDELQDSSPIQLAIFSALNAIAPLSVWVGDPKQSIYGFRDADPALTAAASRQIAADTGGEPSVLDISYRSRGAITHFVNDAFTPNFLSAGMSAAEIRFADHDRKEPEGLPPPLAVWTIAGKNKDLRARALASAVANLLGARADWPLPLKGGTTRLPRGGDVAILCRTNPQVEQLAAALTQAGLKTAVERGGLLHTPEAELILAALRLAGDASDRLAAAELARFCAVDGAWLEAVFAEAPAESLAAIIPFAAALADIRAQALTFTPAESLDAVLAAPGLLETVRAWGQSEARFDNLEALRAMARVYEEEQRAGRRAATVPGLCAWLADQAKAVQPQSRDPDAVHILTYHGAKGLEWPIVILGDLDAGARADPFGIAIEKDQAPDWRDPLAARWVRYWVWPYGEHEKDIALADASDQSAIGRAAVAAERAERARLLYVGATRARDYLVLLSTSASLPWLEELPGHDGACAITFAENAIVACGQSHPARRASFEAPEAPTAAPGEEILFGPRPVEPVAQLPLRRRPSAALGDGQWRVAEQVRLGDRLALNGKPDMAALGEACHRFFAADDPELEAEARLHLATANLMRWGAPQLAAADLVLASDRLTAFLIARFPDGKIRREWPVHGAVGDQVMDGRLDLLVEQEAGYVIVDHKSFPGVVENDADRLTAVASQLSTYAQALEIATGKPTLGFWMHQPIAGQAVRFERATI